MNISDLLQEGGGFTLGTARIGQLDGGSLAEGVHELELRAQDNQGAVSSVFSLSFTYDVTAPRLGLTLDPAFAASPSSPATTTDATVTLVAASEPGALIALASSNLSMIADASGQAVFAGLPVALGSNAFVATAADAAGNVSAPSLLTVTRVAATAAAGRLRRPGRRHRDEPDRPRDPRRHGDRSRPGRRDRRGIVGQD